MIFTASLNVPPQDLKAGFPGVTDRFEWFAIDYAGRFWIDRPGMYTFVLTSDDGARLYLDDQLIIDNDRQHPAQRGHSPNSSLVFPGAAVSGGPAPGTCGPRREAPGFQHRRVQASGAPEELGRSRFQASREAAGKSVNGRYPMRSQPEAHLDLRQRASLKSPNRSPEPDLWGSFKRLQLCSMGVLRPTALAVLDCWSRGSLECFTKGKS